MLGFLYAIIAVFFWSTNVIVARYFAGIFSPWQISFYRWFFASVCLLPFMFKNLLKKSDIIIKNWKKIFLLSLFGIVLMNTFSYIAGETITAIEMSLIGVMGPIFIVLLSRIFFKIKISKLQYLGIILSFIGVIVIVSHGNIEFLISRGFKIGDFWMMMLALSFGIYSVMMIKKPQELSQTELLSVIIFLGTILIFPLFLWQTKTVSVCDKWSWISVLTFIYMGIFNSVISYLCWNMAIEKIGSLQSSLIYYLMPVFSSVGAYLILGEKIYISQLYGGILVITGILIANRKTN